MLKPAISRCAGPSISFVWRLLFRFLSKPRCRSTLRQSQNKGRGCSSPMGFRQGRGPLGGEDGPEPRPGSVPWGQAEWRPAGRTVAPSPRGTTRPGQCRRLGAPWGASPGPLGSPPHPKLGCASLTSPRIWGLSLQGAPREEVHYSSVVFNTQSQDSKDTAPRQRPWPQEPEYSVIRKT